MKITILCSDVNHPVIPCLEKWCASNEDSHDIVLINSVDDICYQGDILFLVSCSEFINAEVRELFSYTLVLHASDLPNGRGWSPHIWDVLAGKNCLTISLLDAGNSIDSGDIWTKRHIDLNGTELYDDINKLIFEAEIELLSWACQNVHTCKPQPQDSEQVSFYPKRTPVDSQLDINKSISEQFNLLRVCDPERYPAFFDINGRRYMIAIKKYDEH